MRAALPLRAGLLIAGAAAPAAASPLLERGVAAWSRGDYPAAWNSLRLAAREERFGRSVVAVYYLLTSACRSGDLATARWSRAVLADYASDERLKSVDPWEEAFRHEIAACGSTAAPMPVPRRHAADGTDRYEALPVNELSVYFKRRGAGLGADEVPAASAPRQPDGETLPGALLGLRKGNRSLAIAAVAKALPGASAYVGDDFILVGAQPGQSFGDTPGHVAAFLSQMRRLGLELPDRYLYVVVYPSEDSGGVEPVPSFPGGEFTLGFSDPQALTTYVIATANQHGTVFHEIVHQLVAANVGDMVPEWLNEGLASLYEQTGRASTDGDYVAQPNWRGAFLRGPVATRPTLVDIVAGDAFLGGTLLEVPEVTRREIARAAVMNAAERYLMLYLQDRGLLNRTVAYYRGLSPSPGSPWPLRSRESRLRAFRDATGIDADVADPAFQAWVSRTVAAQLASTFLIPRTLRGGSRVATRPAGRP